MCFVETSIYFHRPRKLIFNNVDKNVLRHDERNKNNLDSQAEYSEKKKKQYDSIAIDLPRFSGNFRTLLNALSWVSKKLDPGLIFR